MRLKSKKMVRIHNSKPDRQSPPRSVLDSDSLITGIKQC
jgi:hypothetical protein